MAKVLVVYYTSTGNTEMLAESITEGLNEAGAEVTYKTVYDTTPEEVSDYEKVAFGCSASGDEELDETEFEPYMAETLPLLAGKTVALFGCWGWGEGEFMRKWEQRVKDAGATLFEEGFTNLETPGDEELENAKSFGSRFAQV